MSNLTTAQLQRLLDQATPGPWEYEGPQFQEITTLDQDGLEQAVISLDRYTEKETCNRPDDFTLAAHAPELAQEVLRMRQEISELYKAVARTGTDCAIRYDHQGKLAARVAQSVAEQLFRILLEEGDHDE